MRVHVWCNHRQWMLMIMLYRLELCKWADWSSIVGCLTDISNWFHKFTSIWRYTLLVENVLKSFRYLDWFTCYSWVPYTTLTLSTDWEATARSWIVDTCVRRQRITETVSDLRIWVFWSHIILNIIPNAVVVNFSLFRLNILIFFFHTLPLDDSEAIGWQSLGLEMIRLLEFDGAVVWVGWAAGGNQRSVVYRVFIVKHTRSRAVHQDVRTSLHRYCYTVRALSSNLAGNILPFSLTLVLLLVRWHASWNVAAHIIQTVIGPLVEVQTLLIHRNVGALGRWVLV